MKTLWPLGAAIGMPLLLVALNATPLAPNFLFVVLGIPALLGIWALLGLWALIRAVQYARQRKGAHVAINAVLPVVILLASLRPFQCIRFCNDCGDIGYFIAKRSSYLEAIRATPFRGTPRLLVFNRGGMLWASRGFVYDESNEVTRDEQLRSAGWKARADETELTCGYYAQPFPGHLPITQHWYLASFNC